MDSRMNHERSGVQQPVLATFDHIAFLVHTNQIRGFDQTKRGAEWVHPERVWFHGIAVGNVSRNSLIVAIFGEDSKCGSQASFPVCSGFVGILKRGRPGSKLVH